MKNSLIFKTSAFLRRFIIVSILINGTLFMDSCKVEEVEENNISISEKLSKDLDFKSSIEQMSLMQIKIATKVKDMSVEDRKIFLKSVIQKSQSENPEDLIVLSKMIGYTNQKEMTDAVEGYARSVSNFSKRFPELREKGNDIPKILEGGLAELTKQENGKSARISSFSLEGAYMTDEYDLISPGNGKCRRGYNACLLKTWGAGTAVILACSGLIIPVIAGACMIAATIGTIAGYAECYEVYCDVEDFYAPQPDEWEVRGNRRPPLILPALPTYPITIWGINIPLN